MLLETQPRELGRRIILSGHTNDLRRERMPNDSIRESLDRIAIIIFCRTDDPTIGESDISIEGANQTNTFIRLGRDDIEGFVTLLANELKSSESRGGNECVRTCGTRGAS